MKCFIFGADNSNPDTALTNYNRINSIFPSSWTTNESLCRVVTPVAMDLSNFYMQVDVAPGTGKSYTYTIMKNSVATALTVTISDLAISAQDTVHIVTFAAGDTMSIQSVPTGTPTSPNNQYWNLQVGSVGQFAPLLTSLPPMSTSVTNYGSLLAGHGNAGGWTVTEANLQTIVPASGMLSNFYATGATAPGAAKSYAFTIMKNGVATALTATLSGTNTVVSNTSSSVSVVAGDTLTVQSVPTGGPAGSAPSFGIAFTPLNNGENFMGFGSASAPSISVVNYEQILGIGNQAWSATESSRYMIPGPCTLRSLNVKIGTAPGVGKSYAFTVRKSGVDTALTVTISDANTTASITGNINCAQGEFILVKCTPTGTPLSATGGVHIGLTLYNDPKSPVVFMY